MSSSENENYEGKDPMSPEKITSHEPTAVKRDSTDQEIDESGQTGIDSEEAREKYRKKGMTKVSGGDSYQNTNTGYEGKDPMSPEKVTSHEPTAVKRDSTTYTDDRDSSSYGEVKDDVKEGAESTFDKLKAGAKAVGKKITDPDSSLKEEYNQEKSE